MELQSETAVTVHSATSVGNDGLHMTANRYGSMIARITRGMGAGQERAIMANTGTTLTVSPGWTVVPDASSFFVVAETGWQFGALAKSSPVQFVVPNRGGETVEVCGRAANVNDLECAAELSTVTRWQIGGSGTTDAAVPAEPYFGLGAGQGGGSGHARQGAQRRELQPLAAADEGAQGMRRQDACQRAPHIEQYRFPGDRLAQLAQGDVAHGLGVPAEHLA